MRHDEPPQKAAELPPEVLAAMDRMRNSPYTTYVENLQPFVKGKTVIFSETGTSGFFLFLDGGNWVEVFLLDETLRWATGTGKPDPKQIDLLKSPACGNGTEKPKEDVPYAWETCDLENEVAKAHGKSITSLAIGEKTFSFCFPDGWELEPSIVKDADGRPALRVFWEKW
jgi:hypothetical protein